MRTAARSLEIAELAVRFRDAGVVGFDIAGAEAGFPPTRHLDAFQYVMRENFHTTIHAGEAFGLPSIWEAVQWCGAERLGHGVRLVDDITGPPGAEHLGRLAAYVRDTRIPLELCPTSNVNTGVCASIADHPIGMLRRLRFRVTVNTDNRLMSDTSMTKEMAKMVDAFGWGLDDFEWITINAVKSAFAPFPERLRIINGVVKPRYALLRAETAFGTTWGDDVTVEVTVVEHPLVADALARIRDRTTPNALFRQNLERIGTLLLARATRVAADRRDHGDDAAHRRAGAGGWRSSRSWCRSCAPGWGSSTPPRSCFPTPTSGSSGSAATRRRSPPSRTSTSCRSRSPAGR